MQPPKLHFFCNAAIFGIADLSCYWVYGISFIAKTGRLNYKLIRYFNELAIIEMDECLTGLVV